MKVSHSANVLKAKVPDLSAPPGKKMVLLFCILVNVWKNHLRKREERKSHLKKREESANMVEM